MIQIAIVEDVASEQKKLQHFVERYLNEHEQTAKIFLFSDGTEFLDDYPPELDIAFLDIELKYMDGIRAAYKVREFDRRVLLLFVTNMVQFALEGYAVDATDFIVKPITYPVFSTHMDRLMAKLDYHQTRFLMTHQGKEVICCNIREIIYIEALNKKTLLHQTNGDIKYSSEPLYALEKKLKEEPFFRCHNAFLVNLDYVRAFNVNNIMVQQTLIPASKYRKREFMTVLANYRGRML